MTKNPTLPQPAPTSLDEAWSRFNDRRSIYGHTETQRESFDLVLGGMFVSHSPEPIPGGKTYSQSELDEAIRQEREGCAFAVECHSGFGDPSSIEVCAANVRARSDEPDDCIHVPKEIYARLISQPEPLSSGWQPISTMPREEGLIVEVRQEKVEKWNAMRFLRHHGDEGYTWRPVSASEGSEG